MTKEERIELIKEAKELGLKAVTIEGVTYEFGEVTPTPHVITEEEAEESYTALSVLDDLSEDEIKYYATPYFDEIQHNKKIREQQLKDKTEQ